MFQKWKELMGMATGRTVDDIKQDGVETEVEGPQVTTFEMYYARQEEVGGCDACKGVMEAGATHVLGIAAGGPKPIVIFLCEFHEGELLKALLAAYLRRMKGRSKIGFTGPIPKPAPSGDTPTA